MTFGSWYVRPAGVSPDQDGKRAFRNPILPEAAQRYAVPPNWRTEYGVRRYGFHGLAHRFLCEQACARLQVSPATARLITRDVLRMTLVAVMLGVSTALVGFVLSYHLNASPGATISLTASAAFVVVYVASLPKRMRHHSRFAA